MRRIVIIGLGVGGFGAMKAARRTDPNAEITVVERRKYHMYSPCGIPYVIEGTIDSFEELKHRLPTDMLKVKILLQHEAEKIDPKAKKLLVRDLIEDREHSLEFDSLIIATGAKPHIPPIDGVSKYLGRGVFTVNTIEDGEAIVKACANAKTAMVVGAGPIGLEVAVGLKARGLDVAVVEKEDQVLPQSLDQDMASIIERHLEKLGIKLCKGCFLERIGGRDRLESVVLRNESVSTDLLVLSTGVRPDWDLASNAGVETGRWGIITDSSMRTNVPGIFAVGDVVQTVSLITNRPTVMQLAGTAYKQGMVAGTVAAGGYTKYPGATNTWVSFIGGLEVAATGLNTASAEREGFKVITGFTMGVTKPEWYPGGKKLTIKILSDAEDCTVLGAQAIGQEKALEKIEIVAMALKARMRIHDLANAEMAYCPAVSEIFDPLPRAARLVVNKFKLR